MNHASTARASRVALAAAAAWLGFCGAMSARQDTGTGDQAGPAPTLEETRLAMDKWIETQQIISKERRDWQQGKEILLGRLDLVKQELAGLEEKIGQAESKAAEVDVQRGLLLAGNEQLKDVGARLSEAVAGLEVQLPRLLVVTPEQVLAPLEQVLQRIPEDAATTRVAIAERYQNVLGILGVLNKTNNEITVGYEVRKLTDGTSVEVQAIYVGLAQAYYVSARGEAGAGTPTAEGWRWEPSKAIAGDVLKTLEILQGKQSPAFVSLPVKFQ
jgi:Protein of unknown function (DUF3450)